MGKEIKLSMDNGSLTVLKTDMTEQLNRLIKNMDTLNADEGSMTVKVDVTFITSEGKIIPKIEHKVQTAVNVKTEVKGKLLEGYELVATMDGYALVPIESPQTNFL